MNIGEYSCSLPFYASDKVKKTFASDGEAQLHPGVQL